MARDGIDIYVGPGGTIQHVYDDDLAGVFAGDETVTRRASHVEPGDGGWWADLGPVGGPRLGPFNRRDAALVAEVAWLARAMSTRTVKVQS